MAADSSSSRAVADEIDGSLDVNGFAAFLGCKYGKWFVAWWMPK